jgi:hypothetical protein
MNINGNPTESTFEEINTDNITSIDSSANIELGNNSIDLQAVTVLVNGAPIAGGVENPLTSDLIGDGFEIQNIGKITINQTTPFVDVLDINGKFKQSSPNTVVYNMYSERVGGVGAGSLIGMINFNAFDNTNMSNLVTRISCRSLGTQTVTNKGCDYIISSTLSNQTVIGERLKISGDGITYITGGLDLTNDLNMNNNNIVNIGVANYNLDTTLLDLSTRTQNINASAGETVISGRTDVTLSNLQGFNIFDDNFPLAALYFSIAGTGILSQILHTFSNGLAPFTNSIGSIGTALKRFNTLWTDSINGLTPTGGVYSGLSDSLQCTQANSPCSLLPLSGVGQLSIPANTFTVGAQYHLICSGEIPAQSGSDIIAITLKANTTPLGDITIDMENVVGVRFFELEGDFVFKATGGLGVSEIVTSFEFSFNKSVEKDYKGTRTISQSTIDTTITQTLDVEAVISGGTTSLITKLFLIRRQY